MADAPEAAAGEKKKSGKLMFIIIGLVVVLAAGGGGAWFFLKGGKPPDAKEAAAAKRKHESKPKVFVPLDPFTVNLADEKDSRLAQVAMVLEVPDKEVEEEIKAALPTIRNRILMILSAKQSRELLTVDGKEALARQVGDATSTLIGHPPPKAKKAKAKAKPKDGEGEAAKDDHAKAESADDDDDDSDEEDDPPPRRSIVKVNYSQFIVQ